MRSDSGAVRETGVGSSNAPLAEAFATGLAQLRSVRNLLCISPRYAPSFGTFEHAYKLFPRVNAFMPPQGLLTIAAYLPRAWNVRFVDENNEAARDADFAWADAVLISGMHVQREHIKALIDRAHAFGKVTVLGGPSVSAAPEFYPNADLLHVGELGDATDALIAHLDETVERPDGQLVFETAERLPLSAFPMPAYELIDGRNYFLGSIQFSSGCPFRCEFCDIPQLYGRVPRLKSPERICAELDAILEGGVRTAVYFVDDNFVANKKAARDLVPHLIAWQKRNGYRLKLACEATLNIATMPDLLEAMREANFQTMFVGLETPEEDALNAIAKPQNLRMPMVEAVRTINEYGIEVVGGIILGLDTDTEQSGRRILDFIEDAKIPLLAINLLYALPKTPLYDRLQRVGRVVPDEDMAGRVSNVEYLMPHDDVVAMWFETVTTAYTPERLLERFRHQCEHVFPNRLPITPQVNGEQLAFGLGVMARVLWHVGIKARYRKQYWKLVWPYIRRGDIEYAINIAAVAYHLIAFTDRIRGGQWEPCFYATPDHRDTATAPLAAAE